MNLCHRSQRVLDALPLGHWLGRPPVDNAVAFAGAAQALNVAPPASDPTDDRLPGWAMLLYDLAQRKRP